jgi:hypothetical protein
MAIRIEKLTPEQVKCELSKPNMKAVRHALDEDPDLRQIVDTPLWLHVLFGASQVAGSAADPSNNSRDRLYARYVRYALERIGTISSRTHTKRETFLQLLGWFARSMQYHHQSEFTLDDLAGDWLFLDGQRIGWLSSLLFRVIRGTTHASVLTVTAVVVFLPTVIIGEYFDPQLRTTTGFVHELSVPAFVIAMYGVLGFCSGFLYHFSSVGRPERLLSLFERISPVATDTSSRPDFIPVRAAAMGFVIAALAACCIVVLLIPAITFKLSHLGSVVAFLLDITPMLAYLSGTDYFAQHYSNRVALWFLRRLPLSAARFLNEAVESLFLIRHGRTFEFFHITFREYIAKTYG